MDFLSITPFNNPAFAAGDSFSGAGEPAADNNQVLQPTKRPVGRPKGSKNKPKAVVIHEPSGAEPYDNNHILRQVKRPVGRPKGSKNKAKTVPPPLTYSASTVVIDIPAGANMVQSLLEFSHRHQVFVTVLNGSGQIANIISYSQPDVPIPGSFQIVSFSGTVLPTPPPPSALINSREVIFPLMVLLSLPNGASFGGIVGRSATAVSMVKVVAMTTALRNVTVETVHDDQMMSNNIEITPVSNNMPPQHQDFQSFSDILNGTYENQQEGGKDEEHDLMTTTTTMTNNESMMNEDIWRFEETLTPALRVPYFAS